MHGTIKVLEDIIGKIFSDISYTNVFLGQFLKATEIKNKWSEVKWKSLSHVWLFETPGTTQSTELSRPEHWSGQPFPSPGGLLSPAAEGGSPALQAVFTSWATSEALNGI